MSIAAAASSDGGAVFIQTEHGRPTSVDPLDADQSANIRFARMIYATPLEASAEGLLSSAVLERFSYDAGSRTVLWSVKPGLKYSDGVPLTTEDVALSVLRMAAARPTFPVLRDIKGVAAWAKLPAPLASKPEGLAVDGQTIRIVFDKAVEHPLFRFTLEIFSIIPSAVVDRQTGKLLAQKIPFSGPYRYEGEIADIMVFDRRKDAQWPGVEGFPERITFVYQSVADMVKSLPTFGDRTVALARESELSLEDLAKVAADGDTAATPASWFSALVFNPHWPAFKEPGCRRLLIRELRSTLAADKAAGMTAEASLFTAILPGYLTREALESGVPPMAPEAREACLALLRKSPPPLVVRGGKRAPVLEELLRKTYARLGMTVPQNVDVVKPDEFPSLYATGAIGIVPSGSGFWALDPAGDTKMLFTPNLHASLAVVSEDARLQELIQAIGASGASTKAQFEAVNRHLFTNAVFNVFAHTSRIFVTKKGAKHVTMPLGLTLPSPWMLFAKVK